MYRIRKGRSMRVLVTIPDHDWEHFKIVAQDREIDAKELCRRTLARCAEGVRRGSNEVDAQYNFEVVIDELVAERELKLDAKR